jgi:hypothetical protein
MKIFQNASLPTSSNAFKRVNVLFDDKIIKISADEIASEEPLEVIDLKGKILLPGGVDPHSHIWEAGADLKKIKSATLSALKGGWTTLAEMSYTSANPIFTVQNLQAAIDAASTNSHVDMALWGNVDIGEYPYHAEAALELWNKGVTGLALTAPGVNPAIPEITFTEMMDLFFDIYESDTEFAFQGYDHENHDGYSFPAHLDGIKKILRRMQENPIHIPKVTSFTIIEFINSISKRSDISFSINISDIMHWLCPESFSPLWQCDFAEYHELLFELLRTNKIYLLSNNAAISPAEHEIYRGAPHQMMEYSYLWVLSELWKARKIPLATCIKMTSENAAKRLGIYPQKGCLEAGSDADFVIYDPEGTTEIQTLSGNSLNLSGKIDTVYLRGEIPGKTPRGTFTARKQSPKRRHNNSTWI